MKRIIIIGVLISGTLFVFSQTDKNRCPEPGGCELPLPSPSPKPYPGDEANPDGMLSYDPNELLGPTGVDSVRWVSINDVLNYTIFFENDPEFATAHAQKVDVRFDFPDKKLMKGFALGNYCFSNQSFTVENEPNIYATRLDVRDSLKVYVDVAAGLEVTKQQAFWTFSAIDPETGFAPWQSDLGVLAVNDSTHVGEGFVNFRLRPYDGMETGDTISFAANIVFDTNDTIPTNNWKVTIDAGKPTSKVVSSPNESDYTKYRLSFTGEDEKNGSGIKQYRLFLVDNLGAYQEIAVCQPDSVIDFEVEQGRQYKLFSIAEDRVGNLEDLKTKPDLVLNFNEPPTDLILSNSVFQDDIPLDGFIGELSAVDSEEENNFTYALAEGEGAIHNDMFAVVGTRLQANDCFKCANDTVYNIRLATTDAGGLTFSKAFTLSLIRVLEEPEPVILDIEICEGDIYTFRGEEYDKAGTYMYREPNEFMCDSIYTINLTVKPIPDAPTITVSGKSTLISSAERGNQWYKDGWPIDDATDQVYVATETGLYSVTASNGTCESGQSEEVFVNLAPISEISIPLSKGWNWISSNSDDAEANKPNRFFESVMNSIQTVRSADGELIAIGGALSGDIASIVPATYKVRMSTNSQLSLNATLCETETFQYSLTTGWNWIPYIPSVELGIESAFENFTPQDGDVLKSKTAFSMFNDGQWIGTLKLMQPNNGYMYYTSHPSVLHYSPSRVQVMKNDVVAYSNNSSWSADESAYPDNMTIIAKLYDGEAPTFDAAFTVVAFCGNECRGVSEYVGDKMFITVHGNPGDRISFKAEENATGKEYEVRESLTFDESPKGSIKEPYKLTLGETVGIDEVLADYDFNIYPNPVRDVMFIEGDFSNVKSVKIISSSGVTLISTDSFEHGVNVTSLVDGVYIAAIVTNHGVVYKKFLKKGY